MRQRIARPASLMERSRVHLRVSRGYMQYTQPPRGVKDHQAFEQLQKAVAANVDADNVPTNATRRRLGQPSSTSLSRFMTATHGQPASTRPTWQPASTRQPTSTRPFDDAVVGAAHAMCKHYKDEAATLEGEARGEGESGGSRGCRRAKRGLPDKGDCCPICPHTMGCEDAGMW